MLNHATNALYVRKIITEVSVSLWESTMLYM